MHHLNTFRNFSIGLVLVFCIISGAAGQDYTAPQISSSGKTIQSFVPKGYKVYAKEEADFNGDGLRDAVIVITIDSDYHDGDPRPVLVLFRQADGSYRLSARADNAAAYDGGGTNDGGWGGIKVKGNTFVVTETWFSGAGSSYQDSHYQYRYQNGDWYLIGFEYDARNPPDDLSAKAIADYNTGACPELHLSTDEVCLEVNVSKNFNTHEEIIRWNIFPIETNDLGDKFTVRVQHRKLPSKPLVLLRDVNVDDNSYRAY